MILSTGLLPRLSLGRLMLSCLLLMGTFTTGAEAEENKFEFPMTGITVDYIDTVVYQWTSNVTRDTVPLSLQIWCVDETSGDSLDVLGGSSAVDPMGTFDFVMADQSPGQHDFPIACHPVLTGDTSFDSSIAVTFTSSPGIAARTWSLSAPSATNSPSNESNGPQSMSPGHKKLTYAVCSLIVFFAACSGVYSVVKYRKEKKGERMPKIDVAKMWKWVAGVLEWRRVREKGRGMQKLEDIEGDAESVEMDNMGRKLEDEGVKKSDG